MNAWHCGDEGAHSGHIQAYVYRHARSTKHTENKIGRARVARKLGKRKKHVQGHSVCVHVVYMHRNVGHLCTTRVIQRRLQPGPYERCATVFATKPAILVFNARLVNRWTVISLRGNRATVHTQLTLSNLTYHLSDVYKQVL